MSNPYRLIVAARVWLSIALAAGSVQGCRENANPKARMRTYPVHGTLTINGSPAPGAMVKFAADQRGGRMPTAIVRQDGSFSASYYDTEDGAPAGEYKLLVVWMQPPPDGGLAQDVLGGRYLDPAQPVATATVREGPNRLPPIELTAPAAIRSGLTQ